MAYHIFLAKESRAGEQRVALIPSDVARLIDKGHDFFVEHHAGLAAGFDDTAYQAVGATIVHLSASELNSYVETFQHIDVIVRAKRPDRAREQLEAQAFRPGMIMIGALDPFESESHHIAEYHQANIHAYSIDQANLAATDPMNVLAAMSRLSGKLALQDALSTSASRCNRMCFGHRAPLAPVTGRDQL